MVTSYNLGGDVVITGYTEDGGIESVANISVEPFWEIPRRVEAEDFSDIFNTQVNVAPADEVGGGNVLGFINDDAWMEYIVKVDEEAEFIVDFRASSFSGDGVINILNETGDILGTVALTPQTGDYNVYETYTSSVFTLPIGQYTLRLDVVSSAFNLNWIEFKLNPCPGQDPSIFVTSCDDGNPATTNDRYTTACDCVGIPVDAFTNIPGLIEAEDYYNVFNAQVNLAPAGEAGGNILGFIGDDTYMEYAVSVTEEAEFVLEFRAASPFGVSVINILNEMGDVLGTVNLTPGTDSYDVYDTYTSGKFTLPAGDHLLRLDVVASAFNLNWVAFKLANPLEIVGTEVSPVSCNGANDGIALVTVTGGVAPYTYLWSDAEAQTQASATDLKPGTYSVIISDAQGTQVTATDFVITEPEAIDFITSADEIIYFGYDPEYRTLSISDITSSEPYTIVWSTGETGESIQVNPQETTVYTITVIDTSGCNTTKGITVEVIDVTCGKSKWNTKVQVCYKGRNLCISKNAVPSLLRLGAVLGSCSTNGSQLVITAVKLTPNPVRDIATVYLESYEAADVDIVVFNLLGDQAFNESVSVPSGKSQVQLNISGLMRGIYVLKPTVNDIVQDSKLFIKK